MDSDGDGDTLSKHQEEQVQRLIAQMNVYSQHKKVMAETTRPIREVDTIKRIKL
jgi:hypothetical protein